MPIDVIHRAAHELALSTAYQAVLNSGNTQIPSDGYRSIYYKINFGVALSDKLHGKKGKLKLHPIAWQPPGGVKTIQYDIEWHISVLADEEDSRHYKPQKNDTSPDYLASATQGMTQGLHDMKF